MSKKKPASWQDRLDLGAPDPAEALTPVQIDAMTRAVAAEQRARNLEIEVMTLRRDLYLAKAKILDLELAQRLPGPA